VNLDLDGRRSIVIGASAGIGRAVAGTLTAMDSSVMWCGRRKEVLERLVAEAGTGVVLSVDIGEEAGCRAIATAAEAFGPVDLVVIASGASGLSMLRDADATCWDQMLRTNVIGPSLVVRHLLEHLVPDAVIAMLSSESVGQPHHGLVPYAASKAALEELLRGWRIEHPELRFCRITVGATDGTEFARDFETEVFGSLLTMWIQAGFIPQRVMQAEDVGASIAHTLAHAVLVPGVDVQDLVLRSPGPPMTL
jgi:NADP-dependent 3-hydroxy acid dehydrogenase YdfG